MWRHALQAVWLRNMSCSHGERSTHIKWCFGGRGTRLGLLYADVQTVALVRAEEAPRPKRKTKTRGTKGKGRAIRRNKS
jgi:hypothetical protein